LWKNKSQESVIFLAREKPPSNSPQKTIDSPQIHHKKPSRKRTFSQNPPQKTPINPQESAFPTAALFSKIQGFF